MKGSFILLCTKIAPIIRHPIKKALISIKFGNHIPAIKSDASDNFMLI